MSGLNFVYQKNSGKLFRYLVTSNFPSLSEDFAFSYDYISFTSRDMSKAFIVEKVVLRKSLNCCDYGYTKCSFQCELVPEYTSKCCTGAFKQCFVSRSTLNITMFYNSLQIISEINTNVYCYRSAYPEFLI